MAVEPIPLTTRIVTLASRPDGRPTPANFALEEQPVGELGPGQLLVRNAYMSVDPAMRGRMEPTEKHYTTNFSVGGPLDGSAIGRVIESRADRVRGRRLRPAPPGLARLRRGGRRGGHHRRPGAGPVADLARRPGPDRFHRLRRAPPGRRDLHEGDVVFVSAAAGAVGSAAGQFARLLGAVPGDRQCRRCGEGPHPRRRAGLRRRDRLPGRHRRRVWRQPRRTASTCTSTTLAAIILSQPCTR